MNASVLCAQRNYRTKPHHPLRTTNHGVQNGRVCSSDLWCSLASLELTALIPLEVMATRASDALNFATGVFDSDMSVRSKQDHVICTFLVCATKCVDEAKVFFGHVATQ